MEIKKRMVYDSDGNSPNNIDNGDNLKDVRDDNINVNLEFRVKLSKSIFSWLILSSKVVPLTIKTHR